MINLALIGLGRIGQVHAANAAAHARFCLRLVADANADAARTAGERFGAAVAPDASAVFADDKIDAVLVAAPTAMHCDLIEMAAAAGKPVLCEKPLDLDVARARRTAAALAQYPNACVQIGFNRRFDPTHAEVIRRARGGEIGAVEKLIITSRDPAMPSVEYLAASGGLFHDMMIHDFDMARAILPDEPRRIAAAASALTAAAACRAANDNDTAMALLQTAGGALCHINCSRRAVYGYDQRIEAFGADGMLQSANVPATHTRAYGARHTAAAAPLLHFFTERYADSYRLQLDAFAAAVTGDAPPSPTFADGMQALQIAECARVAQAEGRWVDIPPPDNGAAQAGAGQ